MEFNTDYALSKALLGRYFSESLRPSIKLWINKDGQELLSWDNLVKKSSKAKAKAFIHGNTYLEQCCPKRKRLLKMSINSQDNQVKKTKAIAPQTRAHSPPVNQSETYKRAWREKKQICWERWGHKKAGSATSQEDISKFNVSEVNAT